jgi:hypothetical protein
LIADAKTVGFGEQAPGALDNGFTQRCEADDATISLHQGDTEQGFEFAQARREG